MKKTRLRYRREHEDYPSPYYVHRLRKDEVEYGHVAQHARGLWYFVATPPGRPAYNSLWGERKIPTTGTLEWAKAALLAFVKAAMDSE